MSRIGRWGFAGVLAIGLWGAVQAGDDASDGERARVREILTATRVAEDSWNACCRYVAERPGTKHDVAERFRGSLEVSDVLERLVPVYAENLDAEAIEAWHAFVASEPGRRVLAARPRIEKQGWDALETLSREVLARVEAEAAAGQPPVLPDALRIHQAILAAAQGLDLRLLKEEIRPRRAVLAAEAESAAVFDAWRERLAQQTALQERAREPGRLVELGPLTGKDGRWRRELSLAFAADRGDRAPAETGHAISVSFMQEAAAAAGLRLTYASADRVDPDRRQGCRVVSQTFELQAADGPPQSLTLDRVQALGDRIAGGGPYRVTEIAWQRLEPTEELPDPGDALRRVVIKVAVWAPLRD